MKERVDANTWGRYNRVPDKIVEQLPLYQESTRHRRTRIRVQQI